MVPRPGDVVDVTCEASIQFRSPIRFRIIRVPDWPTYSGWIWLDGYQLDSAGEAVERRSIFVKADGLHPVRVGPRRPPGRPPRPRGGPQP